MFYPLLIIERINFAFGGSFNDISGARQAKIISIAHDNFEYNFN